jgi:hypothetical protein
MMLVPGYWEHQKYDVRLASGMERIRRVMQGTWRASIGQCEIRDKAWAGVLDCLKNHSAAINKIRLLLSSVFW